MAHTQKMVAPRVSRFPTAGEGSGNVTESLAD